jgi:hypothetical protein
MNALVNPAKAELRLTTRSLNDQQDREGHPREPLGTRQQDRVAADHACALVGVDRRQGAQLISIIFSRTA